MAMTSGCREVAMIRTFQVTATHGRVSMPYRKWLVVPQDKGDKEVAAPLGVGSLARLSVLLDAGSTVPVCNFGTVNLGAAASLRGADPARG